jgi:hypothetical protein
VLVARFKLGSNKIYIKNAMLGLLGYAEPTYALAQLCNTHMINITDTILEFTLGGSRGKV